MEQTKEQKLGTMPLPRLMASLAIPSVIAQLINVLYNIIDRMYIGHIPKVGPIALTGVGLTFPIIMLISAFSAFIGAGGAPLASIALGKGDKERAEKILGNGVSVLLIFSISLTIIFMIFKRPLLFLFGASDQTITYAVNYITIYLMGTIFVQFALGLNMFISSQGQARTAMLSVLIGAVINIILDPIFIFVLNMNVQGAALATIISQGVSALMCFLYIWKKETMLRPEWEQMRFFPEDTKKQLGVGVPMALQFAITASGTMVMQAAINLFGALAVASYTAASKLQNMLMQGMMAIGQTMATYSGQNYGAGEVDRIKKGVNAALLVDIVYSVIAGLAAYLGLPVLLKFFFESGTDMTQIMFYAKRYTVLCILFYIPLCVIFIFRNTMQGCGYGFLPMMGGVVELLARLLCAVIAMRVMSYSLAVFCDPAAWLAAGIFTMVSYFHVIKKIEKRKELGSTGTAAK